MRVKPGSTHDLFEEWGVTGATLGVRLDDNQGATSVARVTGFVESPAGSGIYYLDEFVFPDEAGDYVLIFNDDGTTYAPDHVSTRAVVVTSSAPDGDFDGTTFADVSELYPIVSVRGTPSAAQVAKGERVMTAAAGEIVRELDLADDQALDGYGVALCAQVNLLRAAELWKEEEVTFGILGGIDSAITYVARDTWEKHAIKLSTLKGRWGFA
jgi:hypothetical protein